MPGNRLPADIEIEVVSDLSKYEFALPLDECEWDVDLKRRVEQWKEWTTDLVSAEKVRLTKRWVKVDDDLFNSRWDGITPEDGTPLDVLFFQEAYLRKLVVEITDYLDTRCILEGHADFFPRKGQQWRPGVWVVCSFCHRGKVWNPPDPEQCKGLTHLRTVETVLDHPKSAHLLTAQTT